MLFRREFGGCGISLPFSLSYRQLCHASVNLFSPGRMTCVPRADISQMFSCVLVIVNVLNSQNCLVGYFACACCLGKFQRILQELSKWHLVICHTVRVGNKAGLNLWMLMSLYHKTDHAFSEIVLFEISDCVSGSKDVFYLNNLFITVRERTQSPLMLGIACLPPSFPSGNHIRSLVSNRVFCSSMITICVKLLLQMLHITGWLTDLAEMRLIIILFN